jgi:hypothetical protein
MSKQQLIMSEIIFKYHPYFKHNIILRMIGKKYLKIFNIELMVEDCLASAGGYKVTNQNHFDFDDLVMSDSKTCSIYKSARGEISGVSTSAGVLKLGSLRCIIYNPFTNKLMYYYLPKTVWSEWVCVHPTTKKGKIRFNYNIEKNCIPRFKGYECSSFKELATKMD